MFQFPASAKALAALKPLIIAAPMNGGINNPNFAAAVIKAGGIGSFGFTYHSAENITRDIRETRQLCAGPINANFFTYDSIEEPTETDLQAAQQELQSKGLMNNADMKKLRKPYHLTLREQLEAVWETKPELLTFHFGIPSSKIISQAQQLGISVGVTATTVEEADAVANCGADFVVAQGIEAGGHRGTFHSTLRHPKAGETGFAERECCVYAAVMRIACAYTAPAGYAALRTVDLVQAIADQDTTTHLPIVAAGGIMTGTAVLCMNTYE
jgi:NAD(P)H-dependent flavin oxidoreductase YrpB (nitropropane dioxygenase family)